MGKPCNATTYRQATYDLAASVPHGIVVEVGVYAGGLSALLSQLPKLDRHYIVDSWEGGYSGFSKEHMNAIADQVQEWAKTQPRVTVHRERSTAAVGRFNDESIDFFHTDGDHSLKGITSDIQAWLPKVKKGGILSGDNFEIPAVAAGVKTLLPKYKLLANGRLWWAVKP